MTKPTSKLVVFSDLDGTLLDSQSYSFDAARDALEALGERHVPLVLVSSKTRAEIEAIRFSLDNHDPFVVENGGALYVPRGLFEFPLEDTSARGPYQVMELGVPYATLRGALKEIEQDLAVPLRGFGDMPPEEIADRTGVALKEAHLAKQREYDEPFIVEVQNGVLEDVKRLAEARGLRCVLGGRFAHLTGETDKGRACAQLVSWYRRRLEPHGAELMTVAVGDSENDLPMLAVVDRPIAVQPPAGALPSSLNLPGLIRAPGPGPIGWNQAILDVLDQQPS